jgi:hypothetical protein
MIVGPIPRTVLGLSQILCGRLTCSVPLDVRRFDESGMIGHELDVTVTWKVDVHSSVLLGYSHFWDGNFVVATGPDQDADLFYVQYAMKF